MKPMESNYNNRKDKIIITIPINNVLINEQWQQCYKAT
jgi:hypothetical protein